MTSIISSGPPIDGRRLGSSGAGPADIVWTTCLCVHIQRAGRAIARRYDEAFQPLKITSWQFALLVALDRANPPSIGSLARDLSMDRTTIPVNVRPLERRGLVKIRPDEHDRRSRRVVLTKAGSSLLTRAYRIWEAAHSAEVQGFGALELNALRTGLRTVFSR